MHHYGIYRYKRKRTTLPVQLYSYDVMLFLLLFHDLEFYFTIIETIFLDGDRLYDIELLCKLCHSSENFGQDISNLLHVLSLTP